MDHETCGKRKTDSSAPAARRLEVEEATLLSLFPPAPHAWSGGPDAGELTRRLERWLDAR